MRLNQERQPAVVEFAARVVTTGVRPRIVVRGEVDRATVDAFAAVLDTAVRRSSSIELDLRDLRFMDTSGVRALVDAHLRLGRLPEAIVLYNAPWWFRRLLDLAGVESLFTCR